MFLSSIGVWKGPDMQGVYTWLSKLLSPNILVILLMLPVLRSDAQPCPFLPGESGIVWWTQALLLGSACLRRPFLYSRTRHGGNLGQLP